MIINHGQCWLIMDDGQLCLSQMVTCGRKFLAMVNAGWYLFMVVNGCQSWLIVVDMWFKLLSDEFTKHQTSYRMNRLINYISATILSKKPACEQCPFPRPRLLWAGAGCSYCGLSPPSTQFIQGTASYESRDGTWVQCGELQAQWLSINHHSPTYQPSNHD